jgi:hypothetical protein
MLARNVLGAVPAVALNSGARRMKTPALKDTSALPLIVMPLAVIEFAF